MQIEVVPTPNRLLVKLDEIKDEGVIITPETAKKESQFGTVLALGGKHTPKGDAIFYPAQVGDKVMISKYGGIEVKVTGHALRIFQCEDILAIIKVVPEPVVEAVAASLSGAVASAKVDVETKA